MHEQIDLVEVCTIRSAIRKCFSLIQPRTEPSKSTPDSCAAEASARPKLIQFEVGEHIIGLSKSYVSIDFGCGEVRLDERGEGDDVAGPGAGGEAQSTVRAE